MNAIYRTDSTHSNRPSLSSKKPNYSGVVVASFNKRARVSIDTTELPAQVASPSTHPRLSYNPLAHMDPSSQQLHHSFDRLVDPGPSVVGPDTEQHQTQSRESCGQNHLGIAIFRTDYEALPHAGI